MARGLISSRGNLGGANARRRASSTAYAASFPPGTYTWTAPTSGRFKFVLWGGGYQGEVGNGGASGSYAEKTATMGLGQTASLTVGGPGSDTVLTLPGGAVITAGAAAAGNTVGVASGGDVNLNGSLGGAPSASGVNGLGTGGGVGGAPNATKPGGAGAPATLPFRGGAGLDGATGALVAGQAPGGGGIYNSGSGVISLGGHGLAIVLEVA